MRLWHYIEKIHISFMELKLQTSAEMRVEMRKKFIILLKNNFLGLLFLILAFCVFFLIFKLGVATDLQKHIMILKDYRIQGYFPTPPLYYFCIFILGFVFPIHPYILGSIFILTLFSFLKYQAVFKYFKETLTDNKVLLNGIMAFSLMFIAPIIIPFADNQYLYLSRFTSTIWHNSTTIFVFPFCIWLFVESMNYLNRPDNLSLGKLTFLSLLIILSKPSFLFPFTIVFPMVSLLKFGWKKKWFLYTLLLSVIIISGLILEKTIIYQNDVLDKLVYNGQRSHIIIAPFKVWMLFAKNPLLYLISSFLFIFTFILIKFHKIKKDIEIIYSFLLFLISLFIYFILAESGPRFFHANFYWQIPIAMLILNMVFLKNIAMPYRNLTFKKTTFKLISVQDKILLFIYSLHFISGVYYSLRILIEKTYY